MPRPLYIALIASLCLAFTARAEDKPSPAVKRILDKAVGKVRTNRTEFDKANKKPLDEARAELQDLSTKLIKDGKTEEAGVVLKQVGTLEADVMRMANAPPPVAGGAVPQKPLLERMAGKWRCGAYAGYTILPSGEVLKADGNRGVLVPVSADVAEFAWKSGQKSQLRMVNEDIILDWDKKGGLSDGQVWERIK